MVSGYSHDMQSGPAVKSYATPKKERPKRGANWGQYCQFRPNFGTMQTKHLEEPIYCNSNDFQHNIATTPRYFQQPFFGFKIQ